MDLNLNLANFPTQGLSEGIKQLSWQGGNKVSSGMVACARLGAKCAIMGSAGDDIFGHFIVSDFKRHGIDTSAMKIKTGENSSLAVVLSEAAEGSRTFLFRGGDGARYDHDNINANMLRDTKYFYICQADEVVCRAVDIARHTGAKIFVDADTYCTKMVDLIPKIDVFVGSEFFYKAMFGDGNPHLNAASAVRQRGGEADGVEQGFAVRSEGDWGCNPHLVESNCRKIMDMGPQVVLFTFGEKGCVGVSSDGFFTMPAFQVDVVDTVGAGDVFHGAFLAGLVKGRTVQDAARFASAVAAIKCTRIGGRAGIPSLETAERFLQDGFIDYTEIDERVKFYERGLENYAKN